METQEKIKKLEKEVAILWHIIDDERLWEPSIIREIRRRSAIAGRDRVKGRLRTAEEIFNTL